MEDKLKGIQVPPINYGVQEGVRYVVGYKTDEGTEYFSSLLVTQEKADGLASRIISRSPDLTGRLKLLKVKPAITSVNPKVMVIARDPTRFTGLERIYENEGIAKCSLEMVRLKDELLISRFEEEVIKTYES